MTTHNGSPPRSALEDPLVLPKVRNADKAAAIRPISEFGLPFRRSNSSLSAFFASTSATISKRASTPIVRARPLSGSTEPASPFSAPNSLVEEDPHGYKKLIARSFAPHIALLPSADTEELLAQKGFPGGLLQLCKPYGENVQGKVTIRDSSGSSKSFDDYAIHFTRLKDGLEGPRASDEPKTESPAQNINGYLDQVFPHSSARLRTGGDIALVEETLEKHFAYSDPHTDSIADVAIDGEQQQSPYTPSSSSAFHLLYLQRLLSGLPMTPHETFAHPVACVITTSSRNSDPIEELRQLYNATRTGDERLPPWVNHEYLRYYVLIHDEEHDDPQRSMALFEQMKRHFGLHCHLLRLRSTQCVPSDDECVKLPHCEWMAAAEELSEIQMRENLEDFDETGPWLYDSDSAAVKALVRELVTQSVIPMMERLSATWNDQIVSRRRGISGRFLSLSRKWAPFASSRNVSSTLGAVGNSNTNYDSLQGFYRPDTPEAIMRKLADYAFMLRDYKLAQSTYDLLRTDYSNDKAWKYHAGANEMCAISLLLHGLAPSTKPRIEGVEQMLEAASYSYITRCSSPYYALRALAVAVELLELRVGASADDGARWACKVLELELVGPIGHALFTEQVAACFMARRGMGSKSWGSRRRKAALWSLLATQAWLALGKGPQAQTCLGDAYKLYDISVKDPSALEFGDMRNYLLELKAVVLSRIGIDAEIQTDTEADTSEAKASEEESETIMMGNTPKNAARSNEAKAEKPDIRKHRRSLMSISTLNGELPGQTIDQASRTSHEATVPEVVSPLN